MVAVGLNVGHRIYIKEIRIQDDNNKEPKVGHPNKAGEIVVSKRLSYPKAP